MEQCHFLKWKCNLCDDSFDESNKLIVHKTLRHNSNISICSSCEHIIDQNNKRKIINENDQTNERKIIIGKNIQNDQNIKQKIIDEKNIQSNRETDQKIINNYNKQDFTKDIEIAASVNSAIIEINSENNLMQASIKQIDNRFDSDINEIKNCKKFIDMTNVQNDEQSNEQEFTIGKNVQNYQNIEQEIIDEKNIQNNRETEQETINKISYEKQDITFTKDIETAASIKLAIDTEIDITEKESENDLMQVSIKQIDNRFNSDMDETKNRKKFLIQLETFKKPRELSFCKICKIYFANERYFNIHNKIHEEKTMTCITCSTEHSSGYDLFLHKRKRHNMYKKVQLKYMCNNCGKFFTHSWTWNEHNEDKCSKMTKYCKYCNAVFSTDLKLTHHLRVTLLKVYI
ncbi:Zinc finger protein 3 [Trachymyrmex zeteki]|uniref:Zinc finger protein 3 n=1 Tax=Mycetomoellerius zeteki TaxID=64791 RepID=A0A151WGF5_9HYME|nr:Zinc finger protein 3 [Trachymyrmex zeteki]